MEKKPVVLITGGGRGLGRAMALSFSSKGYAVALTYHSHEAEARQTCDLLSKNGGSVSVQKTDVRDLKQVQQLVSSIEKEWGRLDVLINNAGISRDRVLTKMEEKDWTDVVDVNLKGTFHCMKAAFPLMKKAKQGSILNVVSHLIKRPSIGAANYAAAKAGVFSLTQSAALEWGRYQIRVNAIMPGFHPTDMNKNVWDRFEKEIRQQHLLTELPKREELADFAYTVAHLKTVTGQLFSFESRLH